MKKEEIRRQADWISVLASGGDPVSLNHLQKCFYQTQRHRWEGFQSLQKPLALLYNYNLGRKLQREFGGDKKGAASGPGFKLNVQSACWLQPCAAICESQRLYGVWGQGLQFMTIKFW